MKKSFLLLEQYFEPVCVVALITCMTAIICLQIILRLFGASMPQAEEVARYLFVWAMYLSISYAIRDSRHIRVSVFANMLPKAGRLFLDNCVDLVFLLYSLAVVFFGWRLVQRSLELGQIAPATEWPVAVVYSSVFVAAALCVIRLAMQIHQRAFGQDFQQGKAESSGREA